jgi:hypothetical protein
VICALAVEGGVGDRRWPRVGVAGEMSASDRRSDGGWGRERIGHELSSSIDGMFRSLGLQPQDHIARLAENSLRFVEICWAAQRCGLLPAATASAVPESSGVTLSRQSRNQTRDTGRTSTWAVRAIFG